MQLQKWKKSAFPWAKEPKPFETKNTKLRSHCLPALTECVEKKKKEGRGRGQGKRGRGRESGGLERREKKEEGGKK